MEIDLGNEKITVSTEETKWIVAFMTAAVAAAGACFVVDQIQARKEEREHRLQLISGKS